MRNLIFMLIVAALAVLAYLFLYSPTSLQWITKQYSQTVNNVPAGEQMEFSGQYQDEETEPEKDADEEENAIRKEAEQYVTEITQHNDQPVEIDNADDFVGRDEPLSLLPDQQFEEQTLNKLKQEVEPDAPLTIVREQEQVEMTTAKDLLSDSGGNLNKPIKILEGGEVKDTTIGKILEDRPDPESPISVINKTEHLEVTTLQELMENETIAGNEPIKFIREPYRLQETTVGELLMGEKSVSENSVFYIRNVTPGDIQGLWGIVHNGLVKNFASGIAIRRGEELSEYQVDIPTDADERLKDQSSSFLGRMIDQKTRETYVYNYKNGSMGKNPDLLQSGQEVVIIGFTPDELYQIYEHFISRSES